MGETVSTVSSEDSEHSSATGLRDALVDIRRANCWSPVVFRFPTSIASWNRRSTSHSLCGRRDKGGIYRRSLTMMAARLQPTPRFPRQNLAYWTGPAIQGKRAVNDEVVRTGFGLSPTASEHDSSGRRCNASFRMTDTGSLHLVSRTSARLQKGIGYGKNYQTIDSTANSWRYPQASQSLQMDSRVR